MSRRVYLLTEGDFAKLTLMLDRNPEHGERGGSSAVLSQQERFAHDAAHRFYNYQVRAWIAEMRGTGGATE